MAVVLLDDEAEPNRRATVRALTDGWRGFRQAGLAGASGSA